jgi:hypothetical protein
MIAGRADKSLLDLMTGNTNCKWEADGLVGSVDGNDSPFNVTGRQVRFQSSDK